MKREMTARKKREGMLLETECEYVKINMMVKKSRFTCFFSIYSTYIKMIIIVIIFIITSKYLWYLTNSIYFISIFLSYQLDLFNLLFVTMLYSVTAYLIHLLWRPSKTEIPGSDAPQCY